MFNVTQSESQAQHASESPAETPHLSEREPGPFEETDGPSQNQLEETIEDHRRERERERERGRERVHRREREGERERERERESI